MNIKCTIATWLVLAAINANAYEHGCPRNRIGLADVSGAASLWVDVPFELSAVGIELPVVLHYLSDPSRSARGIIGVNWRFPLLDSGVEQVNEKVARINLISGAHAYLVRDTSDPDIWTSVDSSLKGKVEGKVMKITSLNGWGYKYREGRLEEITTPKGDGFLFKRTKGVIDSIISRGVSVANFEYNNEGLLRFFSIGDKMRLDFGYSEYPVITNEGFVVRLERAMSQITVKANGKERFSKSISYSPNLDEKTVMLSCDPGLFTTDKSEVIHDLITGQLKRDSVSAYRVERGAGGIWPKVIREWNDGSIESYFFDTKTYSEKICAKDGTNREMLFHGGSGPNYLLLKSIKDTSASGEIKSVFNCYRAADGSILRSSQSKNDGWSNEIKNRGAVTEVSLKSPTGKIITLNFLMNKLNKK